MTREALGNPAAENPPLSEQGKKEVAQLIHQYRSSGNPVAEIKAVILEAFLGNGNQAIGIGDFWHKSIVPQRLAEAWIQAGSGDYYKNTHELMIEINRALQKMGSSIFLGAVEKGSKNIPLSQRKRILVERPAGQVQSQEEEAV